MYLSIIYTLQRVYFEVKYKRKGELRMAINYQGTFAKMKEAGITTYRIRKEKIVSEGTLQSLREGKPVSTEIIERLCLLLKCTPNDLMKIEP